MTTKKYNSRSKNVTAKSKSTSKKPRLWRRLVVFGFKLSLIFFAFLVVVVMYSDAQIKKQFEGKRWKLPANVYAQPFLLTEGKPLTAARLKQELDLLGYRKVVKATRSGEYENYGDYYYLFIRDIKNWENDNLPQEVAFRIVNGKISDLKDHVHGEPLQLAKLDPLLIGQIYPNHNEDRILVPLAEVPEHLKQALLVTEDKDFYDHYGISFKGIGRAIWYNINNDGRSHGGSTITQQLVKNYFLTRERTLWRKFREAVMAVILEVRYEKDEILEAYFNEVFLGQDRTRAIHGVGLASRYYFDKDITHLTPAQSALLVAILKGPSAFEPYRNPKNAIKRRNLVLTLMHKNGHLTAEELQHETNTTLAVVDKPRLRLSKVPAFMDLVKRELKSDYSDEDLQTEGLNVFTTLDPVTQHYLERRLSEGVDKIEKAKEIEKDTLQASVVITEAQTGKIIALASDRKKGYAGYNRAIDAKRQVGSAIKPLVLAAGLSNDKDLSLNHLINDEPIALKQRDGSIWQPKNYDEKFHGKVTLFESVRRSFNIPMVRLAQQVGVKNVARFINGIEDFNVRALDALPLGVAEMSPLELAELYQVIASEGIKLKPSVIEAVTDNNDRLLNRYRIETKRILDPVHNYLVKAAMVDIVENGTGRQLKRRIPWTQFAGKTGTTNNLKDSWFVGFSGEHLGVVWLGRDDNKPANVTGSTGALPIFIDIFEGINTQSLRLGYREDIEWHLIDLDTGLLATDYCQRTASIPFAYGKAPTQFADCLAN